MVYLLPDKKSVYANGVVYKQRSIIRFKNPAPRGNTCFNCVAYHDMALCDSICAHCKQGMVFGRGKDV